MTRKLAVDSIASKIAQNMRPDLEYDIPKGMEPLNDAETLAWNDYIAGKSSWKALELRTLYRLVKTESELYEKRQECRELDSKDSLNKEVREITKLLHLELRMLGFALPPNERFSAKSDGKPAVSKRGKKKGSVSLLKG